jgi:hypothetical protein
MKLSRVGTANRDLRMGEENPHRFFHKARKYNVVSGKRDDVPSCSRLHSGVHRSSYS